MDETRGLWRGKRLNNGEWALGCLIRDSSKAMIVVLDDKRMSGTAVDPSTLGECTGLRDKNKKLIFEGDIIEYENSDWVSTYIVAWDNEYARFAISTDWFGETKIIGDFEFYSPNKCTIIGNIHDNPGLLKRTTGEDIGNAAQGTMAPAT